MPERWQRIEAVLDAVLAAPHAERPSLLNRLTNGDAELLREVESLLAAHDKAEGFLEESAEEFAAPYMAEAAANEPGDRPGQIVGRYRLVEPIGRGGMGTVWLAERSDGEFEHRVALKLIKRGMDSEEILARFLRERQILARLEHPNIARLLDGGVSGDGRPYFVMEYVPGRPITRHCDAGRLTVEERLRLFVVACRAIAHAHRNLVVHRDIKPSNVLVDAQGELKLLDFGIARLLASEESEVTAGTEGSRLMTPEYASPEQLAGHSVTTASDIYQLGALLHELLTGRRPRSPEAGETTRRPSGTVRRTEQFVLRDGTTESIVPATVAGNRGTTPERLQRGLRGDLDAITLRALRAEPGARYPSAEDLAEDVERHLTHRPLRFGGDRMLYRGRKFVVRHRLGVAFAATILALSLGLLGFDALRVRRERDRARQEADKAIEMGQLMGRFLQGWDPDASDRGDVSAKKLLGDAATRAERELGGRPEMLAASLSILGDFHTTLGNWRTADSLLARALAIQEHLATPPGADVAATLTRRGRLLRQMGRLAGSAAVLERAIGMDRTLFGAHHQETLRAQLELAGTLRDWKKHVESEAVLRAVLAALDDSARTSTPFGLEAASGLGYALFAQARNDEAIAILRPTLAHQLTIFGPVHSATLYTLRFLASALRDRGDLEEAERLDREALRVARALYGNEHSETQNTLFVLGMVLERRGQWAEAEALARQAHEFTIRRFGTDHYNVWYGYGHIGSLRLDRGDLVEAERLLRLALAGLRVAAPKGDPDQGDILNRLAYLAVKRNAPDADRIYREAVHFDDSRPATLPDFISDGIHFLAWAEQRKGDLEASAHDYRRALKAYEGRLPVTHPYLVAARQGLEAVLASDALSIQTQGRP